MLSVLIYFCIKVWDCAEWGGIKVEDLYLRANSTVDWVVNGKLEKIGSVGHPSFEVLYGG